MERRGEFEELRGSADDKQAVRWYRKVVETCDLPERAEVCERAKIFLLIMYIEGRLSDDDRRAVERWLCGRADNVFKAWKEDDHNNPDILYLLGAAYRDGVLNFPQSDIQARENFEKSCRDYGECDHSGIQNRLGMMYRDRMYHDGHFDNDDKSERNAPAEALNRFHKAARYYDSRMVDMVDGRGSAAVNLGDFFSGGYLYAQGDKSNDVLEGFFLVANELGHGKDLKDKEISDENVKKWIDNVICFDLDKYKESPPLEWVARTVAWCYIGIMFEEGWARLGSNEKEAEKYFRYAAGDLTPEDMKPEDKPKHAPGHVLAKYRLGRMYECRAQRAHKEVEQKKYRTEVKEHLEKAEKWYLEAARLQDDGTAGHPQAQYQLGRMYEAQRRYDKAEEWYRTAARKRDGVSGHPRAQYQLGLMYECMFEQDEVAKNWYLEASKPRWYDNNGHADAQYRLGCMYRDGRGGLDRDFATAKEYFRKAADPRCYDQKRHLDALYALADVAKKQFSDGVRKQKGNQYSKHVVYTDEIFERYREAADQGHIVAAYELGCAYEKGWLELKFRGSFLWTNSMQPAE